MSVNPRTQLEATVSIEPTRIYITEAEKEGYPIKIDGAAGQFSKKAIPLEMSSQVGNLINQIEALLNRVPHGLSQDELMSINELMKDLGQSLFKSLDHDNEQLRLTLERSLSLHKLVRLQMRISDVEVRSWPWELLYSQARKIENGNGVSSFLALSPKIALSHYYEEPREVPTLDQVDVLRVLVVVSSPSDYGSVDHIAQGADGLNLLGITEQERKRLYLKLLVKPTRRRLELAMAEIGEPVHIVHYIGHGYITSSEQGKPPTAGVILENEDGLSERVEASAFVRLLGIPEEPTKTPYPRLVIIYACDSARMELDSVTSALIQNGVPAVIGMRFKVTPSFVITFNEGLYAHLIDGIRVDEAVAECRRNTVTFNETDVEWCIPVLYLRTTDGGLFALNSASNERFRWVAKLKLLNALGGSGAQVAAAALLKFGASAIALSVAAVLAYPLAVIRARAARLLRTLPRNPEIQDTIVRLIGPAVERETEVIVRREMARILIQPRVSVIAVPFLRILADDTDEEVRDIARVGLTLQQLVAQGRNEAEMYSLLSDIFLSHFSDYLSRNLEDIRIGLDRITNELNTLMVIVNDGLQQREDYTTYLEEIVAAQAIAQEVRKQIIEAKANAGSMTREQIESYLIPQISEVVGQTNRVIHSADHTAQSVRLLTKRLIDTRREVADTLEFELEVLKDLDSITRSLHRTTIYTPHVDIKIVQSDLDGEF
jgi:CHAT domain